MKTDRVLLQDKAPFATIPAPCPYFGACGGCTLQDLAYADQLALKRQRLLRALAPLTDRDPSLPVDLVGLEDPWRYRNKAEFTFGSDGGQVSLGYHAAGSYWRVVDLEDCLLLPEPMSRLLSVIRAFARRSGLPPYHPRRHDGFWRYAVVRSSRATGQVLACLITTPGDRAVIEELADELMGRHLQVSSVYWGVNAKLADTTAPDELACVRGQPYLEEHLGSFALQLHPLAFLQPTPAQAERLYARVAGWIDGAPSGAAWDLYCGAGLMALYLAPKFATVYGIDSDARNVEMGRVNAARNGIRNVEFHLGPAEDVLANTRFWLQEAKPEAVVVDPPRAGLHARAIGSVLAARPKQLAYVSCNAQALARDLAQLTSGFPRYRLRQVAAFDLFPHTAHLETLALLER